MIFFDNIIFSLQKAGGISIVWQELLKGIVDSEFDYKCLEYNSGGNNIFRKKLCLDSNKIIQFKIILSIQRYFNPRFFGKPKGSFIFHSSYYRYSPTQNAINFTTVHDFTYEYYSRGLKKKIHCFQKYRAIRNAQYIICISENTKKDLLKFIPDVEEDKIHVIYNGVSDDYYPLEKSTLYADRYGKFALFVGARAGYKNFLLAVLSIKNTNLNLVIVGQELTKDEIDLLEKELGSDRFYSLKRIDNIELNLLYNHAYCLLYTSLYEGFGIPIVEAQKAGCPVIVINSPSSTEIIGDKTLVSKSDVDSLLEKINLLTDISIREYVIKKGFENAQEYSWCKMRRQIFSLYEKALKIN